MIFKTLVNKFINAKRIASAINTRYGVNSAEGDRSLRILKYYEGIIKDVEKSIGRYHRPIGNYKNKL